MFQEFRVGPPEAFVLEWVGREVTVVGTFAGAGVGIVFPYINLHGSDGQPCQYDGEPSACVSCVIDTGEEALSRLRAGDRVVVTGEVDSIQSIYVSLIPCRI